MLGFYFCCEDLLDVIFLLIVFVLLFFIWVSMCVFVGDLLCISFILEFMVLFGRVDLVCIVFCRIRKVINLYRIVILNEFIVFINLWFFCVVRK